MYRGAGLKFNYMASDSMADRVTPQTNSTPRLMEFPVGEHPDVRRETHLHSTERAQLSVLDPPGPHPVGVSSLSWSWFVASWSEVQVVWGTQASSWCLWLGRSCWRLCPHRWVDTGGQHQRCALVGQRGWDQRSKWVGKRHIQNLKLSISQKVILPQSGVSLLRQSKSQISIP